MMNGFRPMVSDDHLRAKGDIAHDFSTNITLAFMMLLCMGCSPGMRYRDAFTHTAKASSRRAASSFIWMWIWDPWISRHMRTPVLDSGMEAMEQQPLHFLPEHLLCHFQRVYEHHLHSDLYCWINLICQATFFTPVKINRHNLHDVYSHDEALMIFVQQAYLNAVCCLQVA